MNRVGKLLIANPTMPEDNPFAKSVIYIYQDNERQGTAGVILNKPSNTTVQQLCYDHSVTYPNAGPIVHIGGPVNPSAMVLLHSDEWTSQNTAYAGRDLLISSDQFMFLKMASGDEPVYWRMHIGISSWAPGQLDMEIKGQFPYNRSNQWLTIDANDDIMFEYDGEDQWIKALDMCSQQAVNQWL